MPQVDTPNGRQAEPQPAPTLYPHFKNILGFCRLLSPRSPRKHQSEQIKSNFCHFSLCSGWKYAAMERGTHHQRRTALESLHTYPSGHDEYSQAEPAKPAQSAPNFQKYISISPLSVSEITRGRQKQANKCLLLPCFALFRCPFVLMECRRTPRDAGVNICRLLYSEDATNDTHPPPIWGRKTPFTPIIFRTENIEKSQPQRTG